MEGFSFLPRSIHASNTGGRQPTSYQNHQHMPIINNDITVDNYNVIASSDRINSLVRNSSVEEQMFSNQNFSSCEPLPSSNRSNTSTSAQHANTSSSASDEFFPRQLIAVSDDSPLTSNCTNSLDNNGSTTNDQSMELLRPTMLISQRY